MFCCFGHVCGCFFCFFFCFTQKNTPPLIPSPLSPSSFYPPPPPSFSPLHLPPPPSPFTFPPFTYPLFTPPTRENKNLTGTARYASINTHLGIGEQPSSLKASLPHSFIHPPIYSAIHPSMHPSIHASIHPSIHASIHSFIHPSIHPSIHPFMHPLIHPSMHACIHSSTHPSIHASIHPCIHASIHVFIQSRADETTWSRWVMCSCISSRAPSLGRDSR